MGPQHYMSSIAPRRVVEEIYVHVFRWKIDVSHNRASYEAVLYCHLQASGIMFSHESLWVSSQMAHKSSEWRRQQVSAGQPSASTEFDRACNH